MSVDIARRGGHSAVKNILSAVPLFLGTWKPNKLGDLSTAGTTACTVIFRQDHFYVANVGDSSAVLGKC